MLESISISKLEYLLSGNSEENNENKKNFNPNNELNNNNNMANNNKMNKSTAIKMKIKFIIIII